jgi:methyl-accepting chemotaxis protein
MKRYRDWTLNAKVIVPVGVALLLVAGVAAVFTYQQRMQQVRGQAAKMAHSLALQIAEDRSYYTKNVVTKLKNDGLEVKPGDSRFHGEKGGIPLPATFVKEITEAINQKGYYKADLISPWPINKAKGPRSDFEREALAALVKDAKEPRHSVVADGGQARLVYVTADVAGAQGCVSCHNAHPESPKKDFKLGDLMGALVVEIPLTAEFAAAKADAAWMIGGILVVMAGILAMLFALLRRFVQRPVAAITPLFEEMAQGGGDLTVRLRVAGRDEIGQLSTWFNRFMDKLQDIMRRVSESTQHVTGVSHQLSAASSQLSGGAQEQASSLEETAASLEEITGTVKQNADNARQANQLAAGSRDVAEKGGQVVASAVASMGEINKASKKIADIITTIDEIAFQTNLLALNAAVEAARAGEQGRGFAVVASEVRNLAQRSATAAKEIKGLIQDSVQKVEAGSELVNKSGETLSEIVGSVKRVTDIIAEIAAASQEQSTGIDQVNRAVTQMDQVTQSNAAQTEELSSTAQMLASQAEQLQALVAGFKLGEERSLAREASGRPAPTVPSSKPRPVSTPARSGSTTALVHSTATRPAPAEPAMASAHATNGHTTNGHATNGHAKNGHAAPHAADDGFEEF